MKPKLQPMRPLKTRLIRLAAILLFAALPSAFARDLTFIVTSDSHYITDDQSERNRSIRLSIEEMNAIDQRTWPEALGGGPIPRPRAVFVNGDIIDDGDKKGETELQWSYYVRDFGLTGKEGLLKYPVFDGYGNHDGPPVGAEKHGFSMQAKLKERNLRRQELGWLKELCPKGLHYSFDLDDVHFVQVNIYPADTQHAKIRYNRVWHDPQGALTFLKSSLEKHAAGKDRPVVILSHCGFDTDWWHPEDWAVFHAAVAPYPVASYFCGHTGTGILKYKPEGSAGPELPVVNTGQTAKGFFVVRITGDRIIAAYRIREAAGWSWKFPMNRPLGMPVAK